jgi:hypothetical protein
MNGKRILIPLAATVTLATAQSPARSVITTEQVARAVTAAGSATAADQVSLPARVTAAVADPALDVLSIDSNGKGLVRLCCRDPHACLPFYAVIQGLKPGAVTMTNAARSPRTDYTMPLGTRATLILDDQRSHIQVAVISLENGMEGKRIRVSSPDHKQIYFGEVVSRNLLRGTF